MPKSDKIRNQELAKEFLTDPAYEKNLLYCISVNQFYLYEDGYYVEKKNHAFKELVWNFLRTHHPELNITISLVVDIVEQVKLGAFRKMDEINTPYISFTNKIYNMDTFQMEDFSRDKIALHRLKFASTEMNMEIPQWKQFLASTLVNENMQTDDELLILIQEMFGFYLLNNLKAHKVFFLVGSGANGKSVMLNILEAMIGQDFISAMSIQTLTTNQFATATLVGKKVNICNEEESKYLRSDRFKALISGDLIDACRKYEMNIAFRPTTKYIFASNQLPTFDGINQGVKRRMVIIPFHRIFQDEEQDRELTAKLLKELPGITKWSIEGARKIVERNYSFSKTIATGNTELEFENATSSAILFMRENYKVDKGKNKEYFLPMQEIYKQYVLWCQTNGRRQMASSTFSRDIAYAIGGNSELGWYNQHATRGRYLIKINEGIDPEIEHKLESENNDIMNLLS